MADLKTDEPAIVRAAALSLVHLAVGFLVMHGVIGQVHASLLMQYLVPVTAALLTLLLGVVIRSGVTPWRKVESALERSGLITDADVARIGQLVRDEIDRIVQAETPPVAVAVAATVAQLAPHVETPDGMSAGAPQ